MIIISAGTETVNTEIIKPTRYLLMGMDLWGSIKIRELKLFIFILVSDSCFVVLETKFTPSDLSSCRSNNINNRHKTDSGQADKNHFSGAIKEIPSTHVLFGKVFLIQLTTASHG